MDISALEAIYKPYRDVVTPLLVEIEVETEEFPANLLNEVRALNDHVARSLSPECEDPKQELEKASRHIVRLQLDCLKSLAIVYREKIERLRKDLRFVDLTQVSNGEFYPQHRNRFNEGVTYERDAKLKEHDGKTDDALVLYEKAYNNFARCAEDLQSLDARSLKMHFWKNPLVIKAFLWILSVILAGLAGGYLFGS